MRALMDNDPAIVGKKKTPRHYVHWQNEWCHDKQGLHWCGMDVHGLHVEAVREVFVIHVGGTRYVTSSTDHIMNIQARIMLTVECIRTCIFVFLLYV